jgi:hypothetical protein
MASSMPNSRARERIAAANCLQCFTRSSTCIFDHAGNAALPASTAAWMSSGPPAGTSAIFSSYAGFTLAMRLPERLSTHLPPISIRQPCVSSSALRKTCRPKVSFKFIPR